MKFQLNSYLKSAKLWKNIIKHGNYWLKMRVMWGCFDIVWRVMRECFEIANYEIPHSAWGCLPSSGPHWKILIEYAEPSKVPMPTEGFSINRPLHLNFENVLTRVAKKPTSKNPRCGRGFWDLVTSIATRRSRFYRFWSLKHAFDSRREKANFKNN